MAYSRALLALASAATVAAHGHVSNIIVNGVSYEGYDSPSWYNQPGAAPNVVGWTIDQTDNGFVAPDAFGGPDIICHRSATPAQSHVELAAGDTVFLQWTVWPDSHHGPMLDYLANCNGPCESVDKTTLEFFKIDEVGLITQGNPGTYGDDVMVEFNSSWNVQIPASIAPGNYVLRHETIALHSAGSEDGAQAYPQCFNLLITGSGTEKPAGTLGEALYNEDDPGILVNIYTSSVDYIIPGPTLISGVPSSISQSTSTATATSTATPSGEGGSPTSSPAGGSTSTSSPTGVPPTTSVAPTTTAPPTTSVPPTTLATSTSSAGGGGGGASLYGQCGGSGWAGATTCAEGTCTVVNPYYSQCLP